jgi:hypothetical protein
MSLATPSKTGTVRGCCVEGRRRVTHRADSARGWFTPVGPSVKPVGEPDALIGHVRFDERGWEPGRWPLAPSYRAHPRLYRLGRQCLSALGLLAVRYPTRNHRKTTSRSCQNRPSPAGGKERVWPTRTVSRDTKLHDARAGGACERSGQRIDLPRRFVNGLRVEHFIWRQSLSD